MKNIFLFLLPFIAVLSVAVSGLVFGLSGVLGSVFFWKAVFVCCVVGTEILACYGD